MNDSWLSGSYLCSLTVLLVYPVTVDVTKKIFVSYVSSVSEVKFRSHTPPEAPSRDVLSKGPPVSRRAPPCLFLVGPHDGWSESVLRQSCSGVCTGPESLDPYLPQCSLGGLPTRLRGHLLGVWEGESRRRRPTKKIRTRSTSVLTRLRSTRVRGYPPSYCPRFQ